MHIQNNNILIKITNSNARQRRKSIYFQVLTLKKYLYSNNSISFNIDFSKLECVQKPSIQRICIK